MSAPRAAGLCAAIVAAALELTSCSGSHSDATGFVPNQAALPLLAASGAATQTQKATVLGELNELQPNVSAPTTPFDATQFGTDLPNVANSKCKAYNYVLQRASRWPADRRSTFRNNPANLVATSTTTIASKAGKDASQWLPAAAGDRCNYVAQQIAVKLDFALTVTTAERAAMAGFLKACPDVFITPQPTSGPPTAGSPPPPSPSPTKTHKAPTDQEAQGRQAHPEEDRQAEADAHEDAEAAADTKAHRHRHGDGNRDSFAVASVEVGLHELATSLGDAAR